MVGSYPGVLPLLWKAHRCLPSGAIYLRSKLYESTSVVITTNLSFSEWATVFEDATMTIALEGVRIFV